MKGPDSYWCSKQFVGGELTDTTITISFPSNVWAAGFRVKPYGEYRFHRYRFVIDGTQVQDTTDVTPLTAGWNVFTFANTIEGAKFELIIDLGSGIQSYMYMCIAQLEMRIGKERLYYYS